MATARSRRGVHGVVVNLGPEGDPTHARAARRLGGDLDEKVVLVAGYDAHANAVGVGGGLKGDVIAPRGVLGHGFDVRVEIFGNVGGVILGGAAELVDDDGATLGVTLLVAE